MVKWIINDKWYSEKKPDVDNKAETIVIAAAKIINAEIRGKKKDIESYPTNEDITDVDQGKKWIHQLQTFLKTICFIRA